MNGARDRGIDNRGNIIPSIIYVMIMATGSSCVPERGRFHLNFFGSINLSLDGKTAWLKDNVESGAFSKEPIPVGWQFSVKVLEKSPFVGLNRVRFKIIIISEKV